MEHKYTNKIHKLSSKITHMKKTMVLASTLDHEEDMLIRERLLIDRERKLMEEESRLLQKERQMLSIEQKSFYVWSNRAQEKEVQKLAQQQETNNANGTILATPTSGERNVHMTNSAVAVVPVTITTPSFVASPPSSLLTPPQTVSPHTQKKKASMWGKLRRAVVDTSGNDGRVNDLRIKMKALQDQEKRRTQIEVVARENDKGGLEKGGVLLEHPSSPKVYEAIQSALQTCLNSSPKNKESSITDYTAGEANNGTNRKRESSVPPVHVLEELVLPKPASSGVAGVNAVSRLLKVEPNEAIMVQAGEGVHGSRMLKVKEHANEMFGDDKEEEDEEQEGIASVAVDAVTVGAVTADVDTAFNEVGTVTAATTGDVTAATVASVTVGAATVGATTADVDTASNDVGTVNAATTGDVTVASVTVGAATVGAATVGATTATGNSALEEKRKHASSGTANMNAVSINEKKETTMMQEAVQSGGMYKLFYADNSQKMLCTDLFSSEVRKEATKEEGDPDEIKDVVLLRSAVQHWKFVHTLQVTLGKQLKIVSSTSNKQQSDLKWVNGELKEVYS